MTAPRTSYQKTWRSHVVAASDSFGDKLLYVDRTSFMR